MKSIFIIMFILLTWPLFALGDIRHPIAFDATVHQSELDPTQFLIIDNSQKTAQRLENSQLKGPITVVDDACIDKTLLYTPPFLTGQSVTCLVTESNELKLVNRTEPLPNSFALAYLGRAKDKDYFLINSGAYGGVGSPEIVVKAVNRKSPGSKIVRFITDVPGFSGGMGLDRQNQRFYYTEATGGPANQIYSFDVSKLLVLAASGTTLTFNEVFKDPVGPLAELKLSFKLFADDGVLLYDNSDAYGQSFASYLVKGSGVEVFALDTGCRILGLHAQKLYEHCAGKGISVRGIFD